MKRVLRIGRAALALFLLGLTLLVAGNAEVRNGLLLKVAPAYTKELLFHRFSAGSGQIVYLLGTIHADHLSTEDYSLLHLEAVIDHLRPDLLLVESRPEELEKDNWGDGPIEMPFASLTARALGIQVAGMDWWRKEDTRNVLELFIITNSEEREERMMQNILLNLPGRRTALILTGFSHIEGFRQRLRAAGFAEANFPSEEKRALFDTGGRTFSFPPGLTNYIQKRIETDEAAAQAETDPDWRARIEDGIAFRQQLLEAIAEVGERQP